jgi:DHA2 family multidrug resistance protein
LRTLNGEVSRQALTIAYINDFRFMMYGTLLALPLLLLLRPPNRSPSKPPGSPAAAR